MQAPLRVEMCHPGRGFAHPVGVADNDPSKVDTVRGDDGARDAREEPHTPRHPDPAGERLTRMLKGPENAAHCFAWCSTDCRQHGCRNVRGDT